ncbi:hypothetical protein COV24_03035 [candidate division WWE3 bacterium CG10_big_fil_rev_8_21_14_0_10_32_10]|uniref:Uncharacterized protein n=1 Tax=candidate division WWE3 bacterium CG10_big_fil_rev_8_21_14_0_10_32_10 TaxID=1975090 RepID=A0A2H0RBJ1_UNCKA|nr:MAG: hypothetical protein COV24_03035 [candidate division WWE3 bacterium CG10_big_fil_rev_8_21_14_0_10_32_10]
MYISWEEAKPCYGGFGTSLWPEEDLGVYALTVKVRCTGVVEDVRTAARESQVSGHYDPVIVAFIVH